jgi:hypothetical protein
MINKLYSACDLGVNTAEGEGWGLCSFEHAGVGRPQVCSNVGPIHEILDTTCMTLVEPVCHYYLDPKTRDAIGGKASFVSAGSVAQAIQGYIDNPDLCDLHGKTARVCILFRGNYSPDVIGDKFCNLFG